MSSDPLGRSAGSLSDVTPDNLTNSYPTISDTPVDAQTNRVEPRQVASGTTRGIQQLGSDRVYSDGGNNRIIVEDATSPKVLMGNQATFGEGFYVAKAGIDVTTNTDPTNFIFNSNQNVFKIIQTSTTVIPSSGTSTSSVSVAHNLSMIPIVFAYGLILGNYIPFPIINVNSSTGIVLSTYSAYTNATNVTFEVTVPGGTVGSATSIRYYLLQETAN